MENVKKVKDYKSLIKHNKLIQSRYTLEASEQKLLYKIFEFVQKNQYESREVILPFVDFFAEFKGILGKNVTRKDFKNLVEGVQSKIPMIIKGDDFVRTQWYKIKGKMDYSEVTLILDEDIFEYIQEQEKNFTMLRLETVYSFKRFYSMRVYEILKRWVNTKTIIEFELTALKKTLDVHENVGYANFSNFNKKVLQPAVDEINEKSELRISYETIKDGNKVTFIKFIIHDKDVLMSNTPSEIKELDKNKIIIVDNDKVANEEVSVKKKDDNKEAEKDVPTLLKKSVKVPDYSLLNTASKTAFRRDFREYDFTDEEYIEAYYEAECLTIERDSLSEGELIGMSSYSWFKRTLKNKLDTIDSRKIKG